MTELLNCPFCGEATLSSGGDDKFVGVRCGTCEATGPNHYGRYDWNRRADDWRGIESAPRDGALPRYSPTYPLFGIDNGRGGFWTHEVFTSEASAHHHMVQYWGKGKVPKMYKVIPVRVRIEDARLPTPPEGE